MNPAFALSKFKATCLAVLGRLQRRAPTEGDWVGSMKDQIQFEGDIVAPVVDPAEWETLSDEAFGGDASP